MSELRLCPACSQWMPSAAAVCPHCDATKASSRLPIGALALGLALGGSACIFPQSDYGGAISDSETETETETESDTDDTDDTDA